MYVIVEPHVNSKTKLLTVPTYTELVNIGIVLDQQLDDVTSSPPHSSREGASPILMKFVEFGKTSL